MTFEPEDLRIGWVYLVHLRGTHTSKPHYVVVTRVEHDYCEVVYAQSRPDPHGDHIEVSPRKAQRVLHLPPRQGSQPPGPTYFRASNVVHVAVGNFLQRMGECLDVQLWCQLAELAERARGEVRIEDQRAYEPERDEEHPAD